MTDSLHEKQKGWTGDRHFSLLPYPAHHFYRMISPPSKRCILYKIASDCQEGIWILISAVLLAAEIPAGNMGPIAPSVILIPVGLLLLFRKPKPRVDKAAQKAEQPPAKWMIARFLCGKGGEFLWQS